jgi:hypothetical protein
MQQMFLLKILLLSQHVLGTIMPIIRSSRVLYSWLRLWSLVFSFQVAGMVWSWGLCACKPDTQPSAPQHTDNLKTKHQRPQAQPNV